jgi:hypothetical protein
MLGICWGMSNRWYSNKSYILHDSFASIVEFPALHVQYVTSSQISLVHLVRALGRTENRIQCAEDVHILQLVDQTLPLDLKKIKDNERRDGRRTQWS